MYDSQRANLDYGRRASVWRGKNQTHDFPLVRRDCCICSLFLGGHRAVFWSNMIPHGTSDCGRLLCDKGFAGSGRRLLLVSYIMDEMQCARLAFHGAVPSAFPHVSLLRDPQLHAPARLPARFQRHRPDLPILPAGPTRPARAHPAARRRAQRNLPTIRDARGSRSVRGEIPRMAGGEGGGDGDADVRKRARGAVRA
nr:hypothetical protein CFP56_62086 [Quercus suber]